MHSLVCLSVVLFAVNLIRTNKPSYFLGLPYTFTIPENAEPETAMVRVGTEDSTNVVATNRDAEVLTWYYTNSTLFTIANDTGSLTAIPMFDFETRSLYSLFVVVVDSNNLTTTTVVTVQVTNVDEPPYFANLTAVAAGYSVGRNSQRGTAVRGLVTAVDPENDTLVYSILDQSVPGMFAVDPMTGVVSVADFSTQVEPPSLFFIELFVIGTQAEAVCMHAVWASGAGWCAIYTETASWCHHLHVVSSEAFHSH
jgi:hypothetical protein